MRRLAWIGVATVVVGVVVAGLGLRAAPASLRSGPTQMVSDDPEQAINSNTSPVAVVAPNRPDTLVVAGRVDAPQLNCAVSVSTTGGEAWRRLDLPLAPGASNCFWPDVAFSPDGSLLVLYTPTGGQYNLPLALWLQRFTSDLAPDGPPIRVSGPLAFQPRLAVDGNRVLVAWIVAAPARADKALGFSPPPNPIVLARSDDGGHTFGPPVTVGDPGRLAVQPTLLAGPDGLVVVGALDLGDDLTTYESGDGSLPGPPPAGPWRVVSWTSTDGGATFADATVVADRVVPSQRVLIDLAAAPAFALDPARRRLYAAWESGGDVEVARSDDGGTTWGASHRLGPAAGAQFLPGIGVAPDGRVDVAFYDRSRDRADILADVVLASSTDGGRSFVSTRVSDQSFDTRVGSFTGDNVMLGSHLAVVSQPGRTTVVWADTARGNRVNNIVDLTSATATFRPARGRRTPVLVVGGLVLVAGLGIIGRSWPGSAAGRGRRS
ncbi:MAG TPA: sialidase family protein [Acidimicrobiales bacterium]|nr:sialidase family protein [Acidimicrobiales bacterium]